MNEISCRQIKLLHTQIPSNILTFDLKEELQSILKARQKRRAERSREKKSRKAILLRIRRHRERKTASKKSDSLWLARL